MVHNFSSTVRIITQGNREYGIALHGVGKTLDEAKKDVARGYGFPQILYMSCGYRKEVKSPDSLPNINIPCPCGKPDHWIVKYDIPEPPSLIRRSLNWLLRHFS